MTNTVTIGDTVVSIGDFIGFKREIHTPGSRHAIKRWTHDTCMYVGKVEDINVDSFPGSIQLSNAVWGKEWVNLDGEITVIQHHAYREVGYWELTLKLTLSDRDSTGVYYWDGTKWRDSPNGSKVAVGNYKFTKEYYLGPSGIESN